MSNPMARYNARIISLRYTIATASVMFINGMLVMVIANMAGWCA